MYPNSERSEHFWVTKCFFNLLLEVSHRSNKLELWKLELDKKYLDGHLPKLLYRSRAERHFNGTENVIWAGFGRLAILKKESLG